MEDLKIGQVWRKKDNGKTMMDKVCIVALSRDNMVFLAGVIDQVDPEWTRQYLWDNYELDHDYV